MQSFSLDGISMQIPDSWHGRLFVYDGPEVGDAVAYPTGHFATFSLPPIESTGSFGSGATAVMSSSDIFVALLEYVVDQKVQAGVGLFSAQGVPSGLAQEDFASNTLQVARVNQVGCQRFFTAAGRAFCLFVVMGDVSFAAPQLPTLGAVLPSMSIAPRPVASTP
jgi:hypothetical protein